METQEKTWAGHVNDMQFKCYCVNSIYRVLWNKLRVVTYTIQMHEYSNIALD